MKSSRFFANILTIGFALFSMFFGAGNVIFPPFLGLQSGRLWLEGFAAYYVADVLLAILALFALLQAGSASRLLERLGKKAAAVLMTVIILCIGPLLAIPRTAATTFELGVGELLPSVSPILFSVLFFALILALSIQESSVIDIIGKFLTPALLLGLAVMILVGIIHPIGHVSDTVRVDSVLETGIEAGYQTLDVLAALVFGAVLVKSAEEKGYHEEKPRLRVLFGSAIVSGGLLLLVYLGLAWLGASASEVYASETSRAALVISIVQHLLGRPGLVLFSVVVALACITTAVGLVSSTADHFATLSRGKVSYRLCVLITCVFSALISNLGLDTIISIAAPILGIVYPPVLVLVAVSLLMPHMSNSICISAVLGALIMSVLSTADSLGLAMPWLHKMPLANVDMAWILPSVLCGVAAFLYRLPWLERAED